LENKVAPPCKPYFAMASATRTRNAKAEKQTRQTKKGKSRKKTM